ncbi:MAG: hypothetical protein HFH66_12640 [Lachnospiraceae bacterium]|nr:hypothetical protein [Lachnospiraceae bacterium]
MKKILVFRTGKISVFDLLMLKILDENSEIMCFVQENIIDSIKQKYPSVHFISIKQNYFDYDSFLEKVYINNKKFDDIYIISSGIDFVGFDSIFKIIELFEYKNLIFFNKNGNIKIEKNTIFYKTKEKIYVFLIKIYIICINYFYSKVDYKMH